MKKDFSKIERNLKGVQYESLRKKIDSKFNSVHDELSDCYYNKKPFRSYGILTKEKFDKLHGLIFMKRDVVLRQENLKQEKKYKDKEITDIEENKKVIKQIAELEKEGIKLIVE